MTGRDYPAAPAGPFPRPPATVTDDADRELRLRPATEDDRERLVAMYREFDSADRAQGIPPVREDAIRDWLDVLLGEDCHNVVALHDETVVGHATLVADDGESYELAIFVDGPYQGAGVGTHLLEHLLGHAQEQGLERVWLTVERWNEPAIALYRTVGFERTSSESFEIEMAIRL